MARQAHGFDAEVQNGPPPPRSLAADAQDCIMVRIARRSTEYKVVARTTLTTWQAPPQIVSSTLLSPAAKQRREAAVAME